MDPLAKAARFFAFTYYLNSSKGNKPLHSPLEAGQFARGNWKQFLSYVQDARFLTTPERFKHKMKCEKLLRVNVQKIAQ